MKLLITTGNGPPDGDLTVSPQVVPLIHVPVPGTRAHVSSPVQLTSVVVAVPLPLVSIHPEAARFPLQYRKYSMCFWPFPVYEIESAVPVPELIKIASLITGQACGKAIIEMQSSPTSSVNFFIFFFLGDRFCVTEKLLNGIQRRKY